MQNMSMFFFFVSNEINFLSCSANSESIFPVKVNDFLAPFDLIKPQVSWVSSTRVLGIWKLLVILWFNDLWLCYKLVIDSYTV